MRIFLVALLYLTTPSLAHEAKSGWSYDPTCCGNSDCHEIEDTDVLVVPGGWQIKATGEVFKSTEVKHSPDGRFHRCSAMGKVNGRTYCLYTPPFGM